MSFENRDCPCGLSKEPETMLCTQCHDAFEERPEMRTFNDAHSPRDLRRQAAIILCTLARRRRVVLVFDPPLRNQCFTVISSSRQP
jgi:hypothetical protein